MASVCCKWTQFMMCAGPTLPKVLPIFILLDVNITTQPEK